MASKQDVAGLLLDRYGQTYAAEAGIRLKDSPAPLYQLLVLATLLSARIKADIAVAAAKELFRGGYRTPRAMSRASWQDRVDALGRGHYRRYDERTSTMLGDGAHLVLDRWKGDLRRMRDEAGGATGLQERLTDVPGIGPTGADIFCREVQGVWPELAPYVDRRAADGAARVGLPRTPARLASYVSAQDFPRLVAACVRATLDDDIVRAVRER